MKMTKIPELLQEATKQMNDGKYSRAFTILRDLLATEPSNHEARRLLATLLLKFGNLATAKSAFDSLLHEALQRHDYAEAESLLREYLAVGPRCVPFLEMLGQVYERQGDELSAALEYGKAVDVLLEDSEPNQRTRASELYEKIKQLAPCSLVASRLAPFFDPSPTPRPEAAPDLVGVDEPTQEEAAAWEEQIEPTAEEPQPFRFTSSWAGEEPASQSLRSPAGDSAMNEAGFEEEASDEALVGTESGQELEEYQAVGEESTGWLEQADAGSEDEEKVPFPPVNQMSISEPTSAPQEAASIGEEAAEPSWRKPDPEPLPQPAEAGPVPELGAITSAGARIGPSGEPSLASEPAPPIPLGEPAVAAYAAHSSSTEALSVEAGKPAYRRRSDDECPFEPRCNALVSLVDRLASIIRGAFVALGAGTRLSILLIAGVVVLLLVAFGFTVGLWLLLEERPTQIYRELMQVEAPHILDEPKQNGYFLLLGFNTGGLLDPVQVGYEQWLEPKKNHGPVCFAPQEKGRSMFHDTPERRTLLRLVRESSSAERLKAEVGMLRGSLDPQGYLMSRYHRWLGMSFEDWGYGRLDSPDCARILAIHRLYLTEGFSEGTDKGLDRLETDLAVWRNVLAQARTLSMKVMAVEAIHDDTAVMSGLLAQPALENRWLQRLMRWARPFTQDERSLRWPMHSEFLLETKRVNMRFRARAEVDASLAAVAANMPLPKQRALNRYADYYNARMQVTWSPKGTMPKLYDFVRTPPRTWSDYLVNPLDNLIGGGTIPDWDSLMGVIMETDARLRLAGIQARLRGASSEPIPSRIAEAGPSFYDPFTELPMLLNAAQGRLYSVGMDGQDNGGDPDLDVSVDLPVK